MYESDKLDKMQNEAARIVTGAKKLVLQSLYIDMGWESLAARREKQITYIKLQNAKWSDP